MKKEQLYKLVEITIIATFFMTFFEAIFSIPNVTDTISNYINGINNKTLLWLAIWLIMFIQVCIIPIPAYIVLNTAVNIGIIEKNLGFLVTLGSSSFWIFVVVCITAYMAGAIVAYFMGLKFGRKALIWCAGSFEDYDKWRSFIIQKGKWAYALTVLLPVFPDDLLCLVVGSMKFDFGFFVGSNLFGRTIGLLATLLFLVVFDRLTNGSIPWPLIIWSTILIILIIVFIKLKRDLKKEKIS